MITGTDQQEKAQSAHDRRAAARTALGGMIRALGCQLSECAGLEDDPEGLVTVQIPVSKTLAKQWLESLRYAEARI